MVKQFFRGLRPQTSRATGSGTMDNARDDKWTDHVEPGDWLVLATASTEKRVKFLELTDGYVRFKYESGTVRADSMSVWQFKWERGDLRFE